MKVAIELVNKIALKETFFVVEVAHELTFKRLVKENILPRSSAMSRRNFVDELIQMLCVYSSIYLPPCLLLLVSSPLDFL
jgi:hypothetical protein